MAYLTITTLIWAFSFGIIGSTLTGIDVLQLADTRLLIASLLFVPFLQRSLLTWSERGQLLLIGAVQFGIMYIFYLSAFRYLPSHLVALFSVLTPLYVVLINDLTRRTFSPWYLVAALLSIAGAIVIRAGNMQSSDILFGFGLMQIANLAFAFGQVAYRDWKQKRPQLSDRSVFGYLYFGAVLLTSLVNFLVFQQIPIVINANLNQWLAMLYLGVVASGLGFFCWNKGAAQSKIGTLAAFNNAVVPLAMFASLFIFGEASQISTEQLVRLAIGAILIIVAIRVGSSPPGSKPAK